jgi:hypothetical protein
LHWRYIQNVSEAKTVPKFPTYSIQTECYIKLVDRRDAGYNAIINVSLTTDSSVETRKYENAHPQPE